IGAPLVMRALADDGDEDGVPTQGTVEMSDQQSFESEHSAALDNSAAVRSNDAGATVLQAVQRADDEVTSEIDAIGVDSSTDTVPDEAEPDRVAAQPLDVVAVLANSYTWDERSLKVAALQQVLNADVHGWYNPDTRDAHLQALQFIGLGSDQVPEVAPPGPSSEQWASLRSCESGGDYSIASSSGRYRGAYQFARTTWDSVAGRQYPSLVGIDPAAAAPAEQDAMALALYREAGHGPWPVCGRHLR
ncbi:transglycosylase family protein, partial [bacterium]|nr:transglycosylase family protein [bacterium]